MPVVGPEKLVALQQAQEGIRNICILAHVDHGKTSLTDALIATNGIISPKLAGKIRYLDSRPDEQLRGITMESSAISLYFSLMRRQAPDAEPVKQENLINLIDSPGHIDFSSEVSTASRLCDGAVILVDAVEGVCSQTVTVLRQSWVEKLKPLLVINKMDRLVTELKMSPPEAYTHLSKLLEQVNAVMGSFFQGERMEDDLKWREKMDQRITAKAQERADADDADVPSEAPSEAAYEEKDDEDIYFAPEKNNVIFSSAIDGWAFTVKQFAALYERKLGIKRAALERVLWGDYFLDPKTKKVLSSKHLKGRSLKPIFVQLVLEQIWAVYEATTGGDKGKGDPALLEKITKGLGINLPPHVLRAHDPRALLTAIFAAWLPLSTAVLVSVIEHLPSPPVAQAARMKDIIDQSPGGDHVDPKITDAMVNFKKDKNDPVVAYVSKMVAIPQSELPENKKRSGATLSAEEARELARKKRAEFARAQALQTGADNDEVSAMTEALGVTSVISADGPQGEIEEEEQKEDPEHLIGFARLYSGTLSVGDEIYVLGPKSSPAHPTTTLEPQRVTITALYLLMGRGLEPLTSVPAGCVFGIGGLAGHILKNGTLCSQLQGAPNLAGVSLLAQPIVRVALEPENPTDLSKMVAGLKLLEQADPCVEYEVLESGEHVILTAGELHLERCLKDLRERFAKCEVQAGAPIVPYRESIVAAPEMNPPREKDLPRGTVEAVTTSKQVTIRLRVRPLPTAVTEILVKNVGAVKKLYAERRAREEEKKKGGDAGIAEGQGADAGVEEKAALEDVLDAGGQVLTESELKTQLQEAFNKVPEKDKEAWKGAVDNIAAFGPRRTGPNLLIDQTGALPLVLNPDAGAPIPSSIEETVTPHDFSDKITYAFQLATYQGPLCNEPVQGIAVTIESISLATDDATLNRAALGRLTGEVIKTVRSGIHTGFLDWSPRMLLAMYSCEIQASTEVLGRVYGVVTRRRGRIVSEAMKEGTPFFSITALLPVAEAFGFSEEMRKRTSGAAQPQLIFVGFEMLDEDPFWVPFTEEDLEDLGELADRANVAKKYMEGVRRRKGLFVSRKIVEHGEKQKTLKSK
ncbi:P-loop containing nucleoside triphosphate hydrolase protein [Phyllosticta citriasiana]|uniref:P-loop containing nucleoside triphosphate hydrolase protein n=1 Tax=Phyllosticta citriasiana TaxID=595635 RepID=A0ABR1KLS9_9PEZI